MVIRIYLVSCGNARTNAQSIHWQDHHSVSVQPAHVIWLGWCLFAVCFGGLVSGGIYGDAYYGDIWSIGWCPAGSYKPTTYSISTCITTPLKGRELLLLFGVGADTLSIDIYDVCIGTTCSIGAYALEGATACITFNFRFPLHSPNAYDMRCICKFDWYNGGTGNRWIMCSINICSNNWIISMYIMYY
jgi:hypothetical protein